MDDRASARIQTLEVIVHTDQATVTESLFFEVTEVNQAASSFEDTRRPDTRRERSGDGGAGRRLHRPG